VSNNAIWGHLKWNLWVLVPNNSIWGQTIEGLLGISIERQSACYPNSLDDYIACLVAPIWSDLRCPQHTIFDTARSKSDSKCPQLCIFGTR